jgi:hypothetical protein
MPLIDAAGTSQWLAEALLERRPPVGESLSWLPGPVEDVLLRRCSVRKFSASPLPAAQVLAAVAAARGGEATTWPARLHGTAAVEILVAAFRVDGLAAGLTCCAGNMPTRQRCCSSAGTSTVPASRRARPVTHRRWSARARRATPPGCGQSRPALSARFTAARHTGLPGPRASWTRISAISSRSRWACLSATASNVTATGMTRPDRILPSGRQDRGLAHTAPGHAGGSGNRHVQCAGPREPAFRVTRQECTA